MTSRFCIYCGADVQNVRKGEHVIPKSLGGRECIRVVCTKCNRILSKAIEIFVDKSPISIIRNQYFEDKYQGIFVISPVTQHVLESRLVEGSNMEWPQVLHDNGDLQFYAAEDELKLVPLYDYVCRFHVFLSLALKTLHYKRKLIFFEKQKKPLLGKYPPRIYAKENYSTLNEKSHFICKYLTNKDKIDIINNALNFSSVNPEFQYQNFVSENIALINLNYNPLPVIQALVNIGLNLLYHISTKKKYICNTYFSRSVKFILQGSVDISNLSNSGFLVNECLDSLHCPDNCHKFRLQHNGNYWTIISSWFGGKIGAKAVFSGPNCEDWVSADIVMRIEDGKFSVKKSKEIQNNSCTIEWQDPKKIIPSIPLSE